MDLIYINIIDAIQYAVDKISKQQYKNDPCKPKFIVSQLDKYNNESEIIQHEIVLTIKHSGQQRTRPLFPRLDCKYGYESLKDEMEWLYNSTM